MLAPLRENRARQAVVSSASYSAPVKGWDASSAIFAMKTGNAIQLKNWFPQPNYIEIRRGWQRHGRISADSTASIETLMVWQGVSSSKMFMAADTGIIYDCTSSGTASSAVTGLTNARFQWTNMTTSAGAFLVICNGADAPRTYNGSAWATPSITGPTASDFIHVNVHKKRLWFVTNNSTDAYYLATDAVSGAATKFSLGANFDRGGYLVAMGTWTLDGGSGPDDFAIFVSSEGQVAVYSGTDPASANTWALAGVFNLAKPIGRRCIIKYGNSPLLLTTAGPLLLSLSVKGNEASLTATAITAKINAAFNEAARSYSSLFGWEMSVYPKGTRLIVNIPTAENSAAKQYVMNTLTGAWCEFDGHDANCFLVYEGNLYFGRNNGSVAKADQTGADERTTIVATGQLAYDAMGAPGRLKRFTMVQPLILTEGSTRVSVGVSADGVETSAISTPVGVVPTTALWDSAVWDVDVWGGEAVFISDWTSTPALGRFGSVKFIARTGAEAGVWGDSDWGSGLWGVYAPELTLQVNGFVVLAEPGGYL